MCSLKKYEPAKARVFDNGKGRKTWTPWVKENFQFQEWHENMGET